MFVKASRRLSKLCRFKNSGNLNAVFTICEKLF